MHGQISSGNAVELSQRIGAGDWQDVKAWISTRIQEAAQQNCVATLLSNEILCSVLAGGDCVSRLNVAARQAGASAVKALLLIRDPVDQALSLYKHRAKNGQIGDISDWVALGFSLPAEIESLLSQMDSDTIDFSMRKYSKDGAVLKHVFFSDWLGLPELPNTSIDVVNPSLTLSELHILKCVAKIRPDSVPVFYRELLAVPVADKASDIGLDAAARETIARHLCRFESTWQELARRLHGEGGLTVPTPSGVDLSEKPMYAFDSAQIEAIVRAHGKSLSFQTQVGTLIRKILRRPIGRLWSKIQGRF